MIRTLALEMPVRRPEWRRILRALPGNLRKRYIERRLALGIKYSDRYDYARAYRHFLAVAREGHPEGQFRLGRAYAQSQGVFGNPGDAAFWYRAAALQGNVAAQFALSLIYLHGRESSYCVWYQSAAAQNEALAEKCRDALFPNGIMIGRDYAQALYWGLLAAEQGHVEAQANVGLQYLHGLGCEADHERAHGWLEKAAEGGNAEAQYGLGLTYSDGLGVSVDLAAAADWYEKAATQGNESAQVALGLMCVNGMGVARDLARAAGLFRAAAARGNAGALHNLGLLCLRGEEMEQDLPAAESCFRRAANQGHTGSMMRLAELYAHGLGVPQSIESAALWYRTAGDLGSVEAQYNLGVLHARGGRSLGQAGEAALWYRRAAEQGFAPAQFNLANCLIEDDAAGAHRGEAAEWLRLAAEQDLVPAQIALAELYLTGEVPPFGPEDAAAWLRRAAESNDAEAQFHLGAFLAAGRGGAVDLVAATDYYRRAAEQGHPFAQHNLADLLLADGKAAEAAAWFAKAAEQGVAESRLALGDLHAGAPSLVASPLAVSSVTETAEAGAGEPVEFVIWDLDDTFWLGALSEGGIGAYIQRNHDIVLALARRGIVSSICSNNDPVAARAVLEQHGIWDYFVFPSVDRRAKERRVATLVEAARLRPESTLFISGNALNRAEVAALNPAIQVADVAILSDLLADPRFKGMDDRELTRLGQYRMLEKRKADQLAAGHDIEAFLRKSRIRVIIENDVAAHLDRAIELLNGTDQLNFTKRRLPDDMGAARTQLVDDIRPNYIVSGLVRVIDDYGDHGYCGFYRIAGTTMLDYCFSSDIQGMGVESWLYQWMGRPEIWVIGDVLSDLRQPRAIDWIAPIAKERLPVERPIPAIAELRLRGGCLLESVWHYLRLTAASVRAEINRDHTPIRVHTESSAMLAPLLGDTPPGFSDLAAALGYRADDFASAFLAPAEPGTVLVYSPWADVTVPVYRHRREGFFLPCGIDIHGDLTQMPDAELSLALDGIGPEHRDGVRAIADTLRAEYDYEPRLPVAAAAEIVGALFQRVPSGAHLFVILPYEQVKWDGALLPRAEAIAYNAAIREAARGRPAVTLVEVNAAVAGPDDIHSPFDQFEHIVYFRLYEQIIDGLRALQREPAART